MQRMLPQIASKKEINNTKRGILINNRSNDELSGTQDDPHSRLRRKKNNESTLSPPADSNKSTANNNESPYRKYR